MVLERLSGILPVNKSPGMGSYDVIRKIKRILPPELKKEKIGHGGTLDNLADGVLLILFGEATKAFDFLLNSDKVYLASVQFGAFTKTDDAEGSFIKTFEKKASIADIEGILPKFIGEISQVPPEYSALRVNGKRSYDLARENKSIELKPRLVNIKDIQIKNFDNRMQLLTLKITCSSGTYIRSIARDMGAELGCGGYISGLTRLKSGGINIEDCITLEDLGNEIMPKIELEKKMIGSAERSSSRNLKLKWIKNI